MAYDLHIEKSGKSITEWREFVSDYPSLHLSEKAEAINPKTGEVISISTPNAARAENGMYFSPRENNNELTITIRKPKTDNIPYLKEIVNKFGGVLVGDEGEQF